MENKQCHTCKLIKPFNDFSTDNRVKSGKLANCKDCVHLKYLTKHESIKQRCSNYYHENKHDVGFIEKRKELGKQYRQNNKEYLTIKRKKYWDENRGIRNFHVMKRITTKYKATPKWLTVDHFNKIKSFYIEAKALQTKTGVKYNVDHIIPLIHKDVCGLHVPWNLQILTKLENIKKGNKFGKTK